MAKEKKSQASSKTLDEIKAEQVKSPPSLFSKFIPHILAVVSFYIITFLYFQPMITGDQVIQQGDIVQFKGASHEIQQYRDQFHKEPLWTNSMFAGMPAYQVGTLYHGNLFQYADNILMGGLPYPSGLLFMLFIGFYILTLTFTLDNWLRVLGSIGFGLSSFSLILFSAGHNSEIHALSLFPICLAGMLLLYRGKYLPGFIIAAIGLSMEIMANHLQIAFYLFLTSLILGAVEFIFSLKEKKLKSFFTAAILIFIAGIFSLLTNLSMLWTSNEWANQSIRGQSELTSDTKSKGGLDIDYAFQWSYGKMESLTMLIPNIAGGSSNEQLSDNSNFAQALSTLGASPDQISQYTSNAPTYWGDQPFTSGPVYLGAILCYLFVLGMFIIKNQYKWWLLAASALALLLSWGHNLMWFNQLWFNYFPGANKFRTVTMALVIPQFCFALMAVLVLQKIINKEIDTPALLKNLLYSFYIVGGICVIVALIGPAFGSFKGADDSQLAQNPQLLTALIADRESLMRMDALRSLVFVALGFGLIYFYLKGKIQQIMLFAGLALLVFADQFFVGKRYLSDKNFVDADSYNQTFQPTAADQQIMNDKTLDFRVMNYSVNTFNDATTSYFHKSIGGYSAIKLRRYQQLIDHQISRADPNNPGKESPPNMQVMNMLNTRYFIVPGQNQQPTAQMNPDANGNSWFVNDLIMVPNADSEMAMMNKINTKEECVVNKSFASQLSGLSLTPDSSAQIILKSYEPNDLVYQSNNSHDGLAVFSEIYYDLGWNVFVDGKQMPYLQCDWVLRGMKIPAGRHTIEWKFEPQHYYTGETVAHFSSAFLLLIAAAGIGFSFYKKNKSKQAQ
jgi:hypothetical protein